MMELEDPTDHGWNVDLSLMWLEDVFPVDVMRQLDEKTEEEESDDNYDSDSEDDVEDEDEDDYE